MISYSDLSRETGFLIKQPYTLIFLAIVLALSVFSVWTGIAETEEQHKTIERLLEKDALDRTSILDKKSDYGSAAYYSFHLTYLAPSPLAFAAMGQRDIYPWKHRIRMLALEGQIYETVRCSVNRLIVPPLPAASRPSNSKTNFWPVSCAQSCTFSSSA